MDNKWSFTSYQSGTRCVSNVNGGPFLYVYSSNENVRDVLGKALCSYMNGSEKPEFIKNSVVCDHEILFTYNGSDSIICACSHTKDDPKRFDLISSIVR